jgi:hypothetical protein
MSRKFHVTIELEMPSTQKEKDAAVWMAALLANSFSDPMTGKHVEPRDHPYRPWVVSASLVDAPAQKRKPRGG